MSSWTDLPPRSHVRSRLEYEPGPTRCSPIRGPQAVTGPALHEADHSTFDPSPALRGMRSGPLAGVRRERGPGPDRRARSAEQGLHLGRDGCQRAPEVPGRERGLRVVLDRREHRHPQRPQLLGRSDARGHGRRASVRASDPAGDFPAPAPRELGLEARRRARAGDRFPPVQHQPQESLRGLDAADRVRSSGLDAAVAARPLPGQLRERRFSGLARPDPHLGQRDPPVRSQPRLHGRLLDGGRERPVLRDAQAGSRRLAGRGRGLPHRDHGRDGRRRESRSRHGGLRVPALRGEHSGPGPVRVPARDPFAHAGTQHGRGHGRTRLEPGRRADLLPRQPDGSERRSRAAHALGRAVPVRQRFRDDDRSGRRGRDPQVEDDEHDGGARLHRR